MGKKDGKKKVKEKQEEDGKKGRVGCLYILVEVVLG